MQYLIMIAAILGLYYTLKEGSEIVTKNLDLESIYKKHALNNGIDWRLMKAIAMVESTENPAAVNPADPSVGLFQLLCKHGEDGICTNRLNIRDWPPTYEDLFDADTNAYYAAQIIAWNVNTYGLLKGIAIYNRWASRHEEPGSFGNQSYVNKVVANYVSLGGTIG